MASGLLELGSYVINAVGLHFAISFGCGDARGKGGSSLVLDMIAVASSDVRVRSRLM